MNAMQILLTLWGLAVAAFTAVMVYRATLTQHETDELFLSENGDHFREDEHDDIVRRVNNLRPLVTGFGGAAALMTVAIIGMVLVQALPYVKFR
jgi:hypothetical protein